MLHALTCLALITLSCGSLAAQELPTDERTIRLRLFGSDPDPIEYGSEEIPFLDPRNVETDDEQSRLRRNSYFVRTLHLPDRMFLLESFPVDILPPRRTAVSRSMRRSGNSHSAPVFTPGIIWGSENLRLPLLEI